MGTGASSTGLDRMATLARATATASPTMRAISSWVTSGEAAKPHAPSTITRTPKPNEPPSDTTGTSSVLPVPRSGFSRTVRNCWRYRIMRISAYEALSFLASRKAAAPRFSSSGLGLVEPSGAANRRVASAAAAAVPDSMNARLVSMLSPLEILSIHMARGRAGLLHEKTGVESIYDAAHRDAGRHANTGCSGLWAETARLLLCPLYRTRASSPRRNCRLQRRRQAGHHIFWRRRLFLHRLYIPAPVVVGQRRWHVPAGSAAAHPIRRILRRRRRSERGRQAGPGSLPLTERLCAAKPTADSNQSRRRDLPPGAVALRLPRSAYNCRFQWRWQARHLRWRREPLVGQLRGALSRPQLLQSASAISTYNRGLQRRRPARPGCHSFTPPS